ncbi:hypothetical protein C8Q78DRAFT_952500, partial [Trametes maxima]
LREHIRSLLSEYVFAHLTTDYVAWTHDTVANTLSRCLHNIPTTDPTAISLPLDPFEMLSQRWNLSSLDVFEEKWKVPDSKHVAYMK